MHMNINNELAGIIVVKGTLRNTSPLLMGKGNGDIVDKEILTDEKGNPYISGTAMAGVLKQYCYRYIATTQTKAHKELDKKSVEKILEYIWGSNDKTTEDYQSHLIIDNAGSQHAKTSINERDGVSIEPETNIAKEGGKYDYQLVDPGVVFSFCWTLKIRTPFKDFSAFIIDAATLMISAIKSGNIRFGALKSFGFGRVEPEDIHLKYFDFTDLSKNNHIAWMEYRQSGKLDSPLIDFSSGITLEEQNTFTIKADFRIVNSLIIGGGKQPNANAGAEESDKIHLNSNGKYLVSGKSFKGPLRKRCLQILQTIHKSGDMVDEMMGYIHKTDNETSAKASRLIIEEADLKNIEDKVQKRIRIDRFTQGAIESALFDSKPVSSGKNGAENISLIMQLQNATDAEKGLLMHVIRDLATGDLRIGGEKNAGRGTFRGHYFTISSDNEIIQFQQAENNKLVFENEASQQLALANLQKWNEAFVNRK